MYAVIIVFIPGRKLLHRYLFRSLLHCGCCNCESPIFTKVFVASFCGNKLELFCISLSLGLPFTVNETTGDIETTGKLDRETNSSFTLVIIVSQNTHYKFLSLPFRSVSVVRKKKAKNIH